MKKTERLIIENQELLKSFSNSMELTFWIISTFGMSALRTPKKYMSILDLMEAHGINTFRVQTNNISFSLDSFRSSMKSVEDKTEN